jgi:hypothetical protein
MIPDRFEYMMMLLRDERDENDALVDKQNEIFTARALRLKELSLIHEENGRILQEELGRFARWLPKDLRPAPPVEQQGQGQAHDRLPRVVQGPASSQIGSLATKEK